MNFHLAKHLLIIWRIQLFFNSYFPSTKTQDEFLDIAVSGILFCKLNGNFISKSHFPQHLHSVTPSGKGKESKQRCLFQNNEMMDDDSRYTPLLFSGDRFLRFPICHWLWSKLVLSHDIFDSVIICTMWYLYNGKYYENQMQSVNLSFGIAT